MKLCLTVSPGSALFTSYEQEILYKSTYTAEVEGDIPSIAALLGKHLTTLVRGTHATKPKATRGFSFHWSNAQAKWDVIAANDPTWGLDGAEFLVYMKAGALSPLGKPWTLKEMQYVAQRLPPHPGFSRAVMASRVAARFITASPDKMEERVAKAHGFELSGMFSWDNPSGGYDMDDDGYRDDGHRDDWVFRDADLILYYKNQAVGREQLISERSALQFMKSFRDSKSTYEAVVILNTVFGHDRDFQRFVQNHPQLTQRA
jgi:hypothetical protein